MLEKKTKLEYKISKSINLIGLNSFVDFHLMGIKIFFTIELTISCVYFDMS